MRILRRKNILHRALAVAVCATVVLAAAAQLRSQKNKGPRALALVEWPASGGSPRVIPVVILVDGRYYDASIYKADPVPMALEPGVVYEVEQSGDSVGMATLTTARQANNGAWLADARFQSNEQLATARNAREAPKTASAPEGPPKLRRGSQHAENAPQPQSAPEPKSSPRESGPDEPPVLRKPAGEKQAPEANKPSETTNAGKTAQSAPTPRAEDSDHPVLRRGRPTAEQAENLPGAVEAKAAPKTPAAANGSPTAKAKAGGAGKVLAAISDAGGPEPRSYALPWKAENLDTLRDSMVKMASAALQDWARTHGGTHPGPLQDVQVRAFDLTTSNEPQAILMARAVEAAATPVRRAGAKTGAMRAAAPESSKDGSVTYWVTLAARQDYNGELRKLKVWATDSKHLDAYPRAELIDAVDADGDGRGELLFREISDIGQSFALYRATPDTLTQLYNSAELEQ